MFVLAENSQTARAIAKAYGHVRSQMNGECYKLSNSEVPYKLESCWAAVQHAIKKRRQGPIVTQGNFISIDGEVYTPISELK
jgi:hypothetical protein